MTDDPRAAAFEPLGNKVVDWKDAAMIAGELMAPVGPSGYYAMSASEWLDWARHALLEAVKAERDDFRRQLAEAISLIDRVTTERDALREELAEAKKQAAILDLAIPIEDELQDRIDVMLKYLAMQQGFTLAGIAQLLTAISHRLSSDWLRIGHVTRLERELAEARAEIQRLKKLIGAERMTDDPRAAAFEQAMIDVLAEMTHRAGDGCTGPQDGVCLSPDTDLRQEDWCDRCLMGFILKAVDDGLLKAAPPAEGPTWQPIETCPLDTFCLVYEDGAIRLWYRYKGEWSQDTYGGVYEPTHWMPLPTPPRDPVGKE